jgi:hypothetical protein
MIREHFFSVRIGTGSTTKAFLLACLLGVASIGNSAEPKVTYVGLGRYSCSGTAAECAQVNFNNSQAEEVNRRRYQDDQDRAQRYVEETRRKEREYERERQR